MARYEYYLTLNGNWHLHKAGCADIRKPKERRIMSEAPRAFEAENLAAALDEIIDPEMQEMGYTHSDVKVFNCAK